MSEPVKFNTGILILVSKFIMTENIEILVLNFISSGIRYNNINTGYSLHKFNLMIVS